MDVRQRDGKPFKSGKLINTLKAETIHPETGKQAFIFEEDDSCIEEGLCRVIGPYTHLWEEWDKREGGA